MDNNLSNVIGERISLLLEKSGKKQKELAQYLGVKVNVISYFVGGSRMPNTEQIKKIAQWEPFNTSADFLLGLTDSQSKNQDARFVSEYTGLSDESVNLLNADMFRKPQKVLDFLLSGKGSQDFYDVYNYLEDYKDSYKNLLNHKEIIINNHTQLPIDCGEAEELITQSEKLTNEKDLLEFKLQKAFSNLITAYCEEEYETDKQIKADFQKIYEYLKYKNTYDYYNQI